MSYTKFSKAGRFCMRNIRTGNVTCFDSEQTREKMIRIREAFSHGFRPKGLAAAPSRTRKRVSSMGGRARRRR